MSPLITWVQILAGPLLSCVILGKWLTFSVPQFSGFLICTVEALVVSRGLQVQRGPARHTVLFGDGGVMDGVGRGVSWRRSVGSISFGVTVQVNLVIFLADVPGK